MRWVIFFAFIGCFITSCSLTKIDSSNWMDSAYVPGTQTRMLVIANTDDKQLQQEYENRMALQLKNKGIIPLKMHKLLPQIPYKEERTDEEVEQIVTLFKEKGIRTVLLASQKSVETKEVASRLSFKNYMNSIEPLRTDGVVNKNLSYDMVEQTTYTVEAVVYDLAKSQGNRAVASTTVVAVNPDSKEKVVRRFFKEIELLFGKR